MKERLTEEEVLHVAKLARIKLSKEEIEKYCNVPDVDIRTAAQKAMKRVLECGKKSESL